jgi:hypothetical protein
MGMGGKGDSKTENKVRFAPYLEAAHQSHIAEMSAAVDAAAGASPFAAYVDWTAEDGFFGTGYVLSNFPSLYDMYGKFLAGLDVEVLFNEAFEDLTNGTVVENAISLEADRLSDDLETEVYPRLEAGLRDLNAVMSSQFVYAKALLETKRQQTVSRFSADYKAKLMPVVVERWAKHLEWNAKVIEMYAGIIKMYIAQRMDVENHNYGMHEKDVMWPLEARKYETAMLGALTGATNSTSTAKKPSSVLGTIMGVAGMAAMFL